MGRVADFLNTYDHSGTRGGYNTAINQFFSFIYNFPVHKTRQKKEVMDLQRAKIEKLAERYFLEGRDYSEDLKNFNRWLKGKHTPTTCQYYYSTIREFFKENEVEFTGKEEKAVSKSVQRGRAVTVDHFLTRADIKKILMHSNLKLKALILFQASSGLRPGEVLNLELDDLELHEDYGKITVRAEKSKNATQRITFCSSESVSYVKEWLAVRDDYLNNVLKKTRGQFRIQESKLKNKVFPFSDVNVRNMLRLALIKADLYKLDKVTKRASIHPQLFRKFFETELYQVINPKAIEKLVGHESELSKAYIKFSEKILFDEYKKGEHVLTILSDNYEEVVKAREELIKTTEAVTGMRMDNIEHKQEIGELKEIITEMQTENKLTNEIFQNVMKDPGIFQKLKDAMNLVRTLESNPELKKKVVKSRRA